MEGETQYTDDELYANGFNDSFELTELEPDLAQAISDALPAEKGPYEQGWVEGTKQLEQSRLADKAEELMNLRDQNDRDLDIER